MRDLSRPAPMSKPQEGEGVKCPKDDLTILTPTGVYNVEELKKVVRRGIIPDHKHIPPYGGNEADYPICEESGFPAVVIPSAGKNESLWGCDIQKTLPNPPASVPSKWALQGWDEAAPLHFKTEPREISGYSSFTCRFLFDPPITVREGETVTITLPEWTTDHELILINGVPYRQTEEKGQKVFKKVIEHTPTRIPVAYGAGFIQCSCGWESKVQDDGAMYVKDAYSAEADWQAHKGISCLK